MPLAFPSSPNINDVYSFEGRYWRWNGTGWQAVIVSAPPTLPQPLVDISTLSPDDGDGLIYKADSDGSAWSLSPFPVVPEVIQKILLTDGAYANNTSKQDLFSGWSPELSTGVYQLEGTTIVIAPNVSGTVAGIFSIEDNTGEIGTLTGTAYRNASTNATGGSITPSLDFAGDPWELFHSTSAATRRLMFCQINAVISIIAAGSISFSITFSNAPGADTIISAGSFLRLTKVG